MKTNKTFGWLLTLITIMVCLLAVLDTFAAGNSLTDAQLKARVRGAFDPSNTPPATLTVSNLTVLGSLTAGQTITNDNAVCDNLTVNTNTTVGGTLAVTGLSTLPAVSNTTLRVSGVGTLGTANVGSLTVATIYTGAVPFTVTVGEAIAPDGSTNKVLKLTP